MESVLGVVQSPIFLGILFFLGIVTLIRVLIARDPNLKRSYGDDRRRANTTKTAFPFHDSDGVLVTENRRIETDRRRPRRLAMRHGMNGDSATG